MNTESEGIIDFRLQNEGTLFLLWPLTEEALCWIDENIPEDATRWANDAVVIEPRYVEAIYEGIVNDGLAVGD